MWANVFGYMTMYGYMCTYGMLVCRGKKTTSDVILKNKAYVSVTGSRIGLEHTNSARLTIVCAMPRNLSLSS